MRLRYRIANGIYITRDITRISIDNERGVITSKVNKRDALLRERELPRSRSRQTIALKDKMWAGANTVDYVVTYPGDQVFRYDLARSRVTRSTRVIHPCILVRRKVHRVESSSRTLIYPLGQLEKTSRLDPLTFMTTHECIMRQEEEKERTLLEY